VFGISGTELAIVALFAFLIFGPDKLPEIARTVKKAVDMFKQTQEDMERTIKAEMVGALDPEKDADILRAVGLSPDESNAAKAPSTASALYDTGDDEEEDEE
jgi:sec-independent protein translocase protein TatB